MYICVGMCACAKERNHYKNKFVPVNLKKQTFQHVLWLLIMFLLHHVAFLKPFSHILRWVQYPSRLPDSLLVLPIPIFSSSKALHHPNSLFLFSEPLTTCKERRKTSWSQVLCSIPLESHWLPECAHRSAFCRTREETVWGLLLLRRMCSSFPQSTWAAALSSCPAHSLSQPREPWG